METPCPHVYMDLLLLIRLSGKVQRPSCPNTIFVDTQKNRKYIDGLKILGHRQAVSHWILIPAFPGSNPGVPAINPATANGFFNPNIWLNHQGRTKDPAKLLDIKKPL